MAEPMPGPVAGPRVPTNLGDRLNTVNQPPYPCPGCSTREPMAVHEYGVRWACGTAERLPPLPSGTNRSWRKRAAR